MLPKRSPFASALPTAVSSTLKRWDPEILIPANQQPREEQPAEPGDRHHQRCPLKCAHLERACLREVDRPKHRRAGEGGDRPRHTRLTVEHEEEEASEGQLLGEGRRARVRGQRSPPRRVGALPGEEKTHRHGQGGEQAEEESAQWRVPETQPREHRSQRRRCRHPRPEHADGAPGEVEEEVGKGAVCLAECSVTVAQAGDVVQLHRQHEEDGDGEKHPHSRGHHGPEVTRRRPCMRSIERSGPFVECRPVHASHGAAWMMYHEARSWIDDVSVRPPPWLPRSGSSRRSGPLAIPHLRCRIVPRSVRNAPKAREISSAQVRRAFVWHRRANGSIAR
jgi:hypothetical protein